MPVASLVTVLQLFLWLAIWGKNWKQILGLHHFWFGFAAQVAAAIWQAQTGDLVGPTLLWAIGVYLSGDDLYQHGRQKRQLRKWLREFVMPIPIQLLYKSPVHRLYVYLFGGLHRKVVRWFER